MLVQFVPVQRHTSETINQRRVSRPGLSCWLCCYSTSTNSSCGCETVSVFIQQTFNEFRHIPGTVPGLGTHAEGDRSQPPGKETDTPQVRVLQRDSME